MARPEKVAEVEELVNRLRRAQGVVLTDFRGLTVLEMGQLRAKLREAGVEYKVVKNTLLARAAREMGIQGLDPHLEGPTGVAFGYDDPVTAARIITDFIRQMRKMETKAALVDGRTVSAQDVRALAELPPRQVLLARVVGGIQGPLAGLVGALTGLQRNLVYALDQIRRQKEAAGSPAG
jgi:large subunit ribosomal protein L10